MTESLLNGIVHKFLNKSNIKLNYKGIAYDSRAIKERYIFVAIEGFENDGHNYIDQAIENGAKLIITDRPVKISRPDISYIQVEDTRRALSKLAANFYGWPQNRLKIIGITGTNGKTTTAFLLHKIIDNSAYIGTIGVRYLDKDYIIANERTTPESLNLIKLFKELVEKGIEYVIMEVSSHSLELSRVEDITFDAAVFTNLTEEHLNFHKNMENYFNSKAKLFNKVKKDGPKIINADDPYGQQLINRYSDTLTYSSIQGTTIGKILGYNDFKAEIELSTLGKKYKLLSNLMGEFNLYNIMAAFQTATALGLSPHEVIKKIEKIESVDGRFEKIIVPGKCKVIVDFAHTSDGLQKVLKTAREFTTGRIISVFGHGGGKCTNTRHNIGLTAAKNSDFIILTADNPRYEPIENILNDLEMAINEAGMSALNYKKFEDRKEAIIYAISIANSEDTVVITGKGNEQYQIINGKSHPFNDKEIALNALISKK